ncbi:SpoIIE family protein phosphatase [Streptomyces pactum]|uniref:SpoIIE family protein phosphatase n=1 Tax=Streptomyces pactum TaxID=68249 RepID=A0ABS0NSR6_9ACTN|nr:SpoIIE family protein phosphatase [Streptomyces pactum]MBH5338249.1 SpoIIE family protein phosphatase [Streptomyces pactum]
MGGGPAGRHRDADGGGRSGLDERAVARLLGSADAQELLTAAMGTVEPGPGSSVGLLYRADGDGMIRLLAAVGAEEQALEQYRVISIEAELPAAQVIREHQPLYILPGELDDLYIEAGLVPESMPAEYAVLPLMIGSRCIGSMVLDVPGGHLLDTARHRSFLTLASLCAHRLDQLLDRERRDTGGPEPYAGHPLLPFRTRNRAGMLEMAMANAGIGSFDWDFPSGRLVWDERLCHLFGIAPAAFDGRAETFYEAVHPEDREMVETAVRDSIRTGRYLARFRIVRRNDRAVRWIEAESRVVYTAAGEARGMVGVARDTTEEHAREQERQARKDFVLGITRAFTAASSSEDIVATLGDTVLPAFGGQRMVVYLKSEDGTMEPLGSWGFTEQERERLRWISRISIDNPYLAPLLDGEPMFLSSREEFMARIRDERLVPLPGLHAWAVLPLTTADGLVGVCAIVYDHPRVFSPDDQVLGAGLAGILAQSLARARLFDERRAHLTELQDLMLPRRLPRLPGLDILVRYRPGSDGLDVGGDWYDALPMPDGRVALVIGDVQGHSARAAAVMGQLRIAMRAHAAEGHQLSSLMARANRTLGDLETDLFATCVIVDIDPADGTVRTVRAGHPHPLVLGADGRAEVLRCPGGMPLGLFPGGDEEYPATETVLPHGATLLLYTDGLVERPGADYDEGVADLTRRLARAAVTANGPHGPDLELLAEQVTTRAVPETGHHDDVALLLVRRRAPGTG